ncbi:unnamed protein product [Dovyalis caffra]|uniref:Bifunctional inhibitor/plant lipid transfer protein/seed storage helical domain-containing protein n=1 Tax=Dovyalis caffra TaxID=77055 RepID=A0AAV1QVG4_9ROSI|nr:unnamed protein product [Dovyalis caffra]
MDKLLSYVGIALLMSAMSVQAQDTSCLNQLVPCLNYLNGTKEVPEDCCNPLKTVIKSNPKCLCNMASNQGSNQATQAGINVTEAQELPGRCGLHVSPVSCLTGNSPNTKNSVDNSSSIFLLPSWSMILATTLFTTFQFLWHQTS